MGELIGLSVVMIVVIVLAIPLLVVATPIVLILCIMHRRHGRPSRCGGLTANEEARMIQEIYSGLKRFEDRIESLETILHEKETDRKEVWS